MHVVGTAGHIDHGKSTLIRALTGIDPDRLQEEQSRGMTIDLGFAWITLPSGREVGIVDVPGHQRFIRNMLAGVTGIDLALFVVAATESWMPQTQEHLDILELLGVERGIVVLTKADLVDEEWLEMVREDVAQRLAGTCLEKAPVIAVSATTGQGLDQLRAEMDRLLDEAPPPADEGRPRLWIDRVFTVRGAGTVVTGTLFGGSLRLDQEVEVLPGKLRARVRGIQTHRRQLEEARPGTRVALNLTGLEREEVLRGHLVARAGLLEPTVELRALLRLLPHAARPLPKVSQVKLHIGTAERMAVVRLLEGDALEPGGAALVDVRLDGPVAAEIGDPFVLREPGMQATLGGGRVADPQPLRFPRRRWRRQVVDSEAPAGGRDGRFPPRYGGRVLPAVLWPEVPEPSIRLLRARAEAEVEALPLLLLQERWVASLEQLRREVPLRPEKLEGVLDRLAADGQVVRLPSFAWCAVGWGRWWERVRTALAGYHREFPLRAGAGRETLRSQLGAGSRLFDESIQRWVEEGKIRVAGASLALADHQVTYDAQQEKERERLWALLDAAGYEPPTLDELVEKHGFDEELLHAFIAGGELVAVGRFAYRRPVLERIQEIVREYITAHGGMEVSQLRDQLGTSRRYALPLMGYFDQVGFTRRVGDTRVLAAGPSTSRK